MTTKQTHTQGRLEVNKLTFEPEPYRFRVSWEGGASADKGTLPLSGNTTEEDARELVRRWNAFEPGGLVDEMREALVCWAKTRDGDSDAAHFEACDRLQNIADRLTR